ncbi:hypothetical protein [Actinoplanes cyaneus]|uniref:hypothetical protein n=1 Tax=Actinoplanes cyaneus TaxID=52696 RepID=UPI00194275C6|nr:hypothetical protein [Actinoplanes cyaneus]
MVIDFCRAKNASRHLMPDNFGKVIGEHRPTRFRGTLYPVTPGHRPAAVYGPKHMPVDNKTQVDLVVIVGMVDAGHSGLIDPPICVASAAGWTNGGHAASGRGAGADPEKVCFTTRPEIVPEFAAAGRC